VLPNIIQSQKKKHFNSFSFQQKQAMAGVFRIGVIVRSSSKPLVKAAIPALTQTCGISGKIIRATQNIQKPKPYPYKEKGYSFTNAVFDKTTKRLDDNSKVKERRILLLPTIYRNFNSLLGDCC
jgi:hypothetical protein